MFANVQIDDHYSPDNADNAHQGIRKHRKTCHSEYHDIVFQFPITCNYFLNLQYYFVADWQKKSEYIYNDHQFEHLRTWFFNDILLYVHK